MGIKTRTSFKIAPGVRVNLNKKSTSVTVGNKYVRQTFSSTSRKTKHSAGRKPEHITTSATQKETSPLMLKICGIICLAFGILGALIGLISFPVGGWVIMLFCLPLLYLGWHWLRIAKQNKKQKGE